MSFEQFSQVLSSFVCLQMLDFGGGFAHKTLEKTLDLHVFFPQQDCRQQAHLHDNGLIVVQFQELSRVHSTTRVMSTHVIKQRFSVITFLKC